MAITFPPKKQFVLSAPPSWRESSIITFKGYEWTDLSLASYTIRNKYGAQFAVEIKGRCFTLSFQEMFKITQLGIPFLLGFHCDNSPVVLPCHGVCSDENFKWLTEEERVVETALIITEQTFPRQLRECVSHGKGIHLWKAGTIGRYHYWAKVEEVPSRLGIQDGNITVLELRLATSNDIIASYDRDWHILPDGEADSDTQAIGEVIDALVEYYTIPGYKGIT